ncbi:MAG: flavodoxin family protein [Thermoguttaceae bacterium]|jgi:multimeric flavodoxin WrbA|nr:flavodoxin family protein [Thermoguttaceae bacterium]
MQSSLNRRRFLSRSSLAAAGVALGVQGAVADQESGVTPADVVKILAISSSPREGMTTTKSLAVCLEAAKEVSPRIETELIELAGLSIPAQVAAGLPLREGETDDFPALAAKLVDPKVRGIIIGSPVYFGCMSALCKGFLDRWGVLRKDYALSGKVAGVLAVGSARNGGQELTIQAIQAVLFCHELLMVGDGKPTGHRGATVWNNKEWDDVTKDEVGMATVRNLGRRVAEVCLMVAKA